jgi:hypothetical protein
MVIAICFDSHGPQLPTTVVGSCSPSLEVNATPGHKAIHYLHISQQPSKHKEL